LIKAFDAAMARTGPYGALPRLAIAVSGGADSLALALLAHDWARRHHGSIIGLIADHGLRANSASEASVTADLLASRQIEARVINLDLSSGPAIQARARAARHAALARAARNAGAAHLLLGHHQRDQVETSSMRAARGSRGMAGMAGFIAYRDVAVLRPLLDIGVETLRDFLRAVGCAWIEDPSNADRQFERVRVRALVARGEGVGPGALHHAGFVRHKEMQDTARQLAGYGSIYPDGFALWRGPAMPVDVLAALLRVIGGHSYAPARAAVARLAGDLHCATLGGVQVTKWRDFWLLAREPASCGASVPLQPGRLWDGRFRIIAAPDAAALGLGAFNLDRLRIGALGSRAAAFRKFSDLPSLILQSLPAVHDFKDIIGIPHLGFGLHCDIMFDPPIPAAPLAFASHRFV
jgi:tRNA(Ile)-lysidine synthase